MNLTLGHILYIPATIMLGIVIGWLLCSHLTGKSSQKRDLERSTAERKADRAARIAERKRQQKAAAERRSSGKVS